MAYAVLFESRDQNEVVIFCSDFRCNGGSSKMAPHTEPNVVLYSVCRPAIFGTHSSSSFSNYGTEVGQLLGTKSSGELYPHGVVRSSLPS